MSIGIFLLVCTGLSFIPTGIAIGHVERSGWNLVRYQLFSCAVCAAVAVAGWVAEPTAVFPGRDCPSMTWVLVIAGTFLCGVFNYLMNMMMGRAMKCGPNAIVWAMIQSGVVFPFLMGWLAFGVPMGARRLAGIALIVASVFLYAARDQTGDSNGEAPAEVARTECSPHHAGLRQWLPAALLGMFFCGINQCCANLPSYLEGGKEFSGTFRTFNIYFGLLLAGLAHIAVRRMRGTRAAAAKTGEWRGIALWASATGFLSFLVGRYFTFPGLDRLESLGAGAMGYPVIVAACIAGFIPYGMFVLHERIGARQMAGAVLGISGILLGCL